MCCQDAFGQTCEHMLRAATDSLRTEVLGCCDGARGVLLTLCVHLGYFVHACLREYCGTGPGEHFSSAFFRFVFSGLPQN